MMKLVEDERADDVDLSPESLGSLETAFELASRWRIKPATLYTWRHRGLGPPVLVIGGQLRYPRRWSDHWLAEQNGLSA